MPTVGRDPGGYSPVSGSVLPWEDDGVVILGSRLIQPGPSSLPAVYDIVIVNVFICFANLKRGMEDPWTMLEQSTTNVTTGQSEICMGSPGVGFSKFPAIPVFPGSELIRAAEILPRRQLVQSAQRRKPPSMF